MIKTLNLHSKTVFLVAIIAIVTIIFSFSYKPTEAPVNIYKMMDENSNWLSVNENIDLRVIDVVELYKSQLGLGEQDILIEQRVSEDNAGNIHKHFQHYHNNIMVEGSQAITHEKNGSVYLVNGTLVKGMNIAPNITISREEAIERAKSHVEAKNYMWESEAAESMIREMKHDSRATFYPKANLTYVQEKFNSNPSDYSLAYDIVIHTYEPEVRKHIYISAKDGSKVFEINDLHTGVTPALAETRYHGTQNIITDSVAVDMYRLRDTLRSAHVFTFNAMSSTDLEAATDFYDEDNYWNNFNSAQDEVATDVHFGAEQTFDFYAEKLGRLGGLNMDSIPFLSFVHVDNQWTNATWNGMFARFGDASAPDSPLAALDVVGHEFAHGLTDFTADLVYMDEPGGLNESFSDIFGTALEFYADPINADYLIGEDFIASGGFRSMSNPKDFGHPDTYFGQSWVTGSGDNGGVHSNSGVQNYWFYIVAEGDSGLNDIGDSYDLEGLGIDFATTMAYGNLNNFLTVNSQYIDARMGSIQTAIDLHGKCSKQAIAVTDAWYAVGVGKKSPRNDFEILEMIGPDLETCGVSDSEKINLLIRYNDCNVNVPSGTIIPVSFSVNNGEMILDTIILTQELLVGDSIEFEFDAPLLELIDPGVYELNINVDFPNDNDISNNSVRRSVERIFAQNSDFEHADVISPVSSCYMGYEKVSLQIQFKGCDSIVGGELIDFQYRIDDGEWIDNSYILDSTLYRDDFITAFIDDSLDFEEIRLYDFDARVIYAEDTIEYNNLNENNLIDNPLALQFRIVMTFEGEGTTPQDSFFIKQGSESQISINDTTGFEGTKGLLITGNDGYQQLLDNRIDAPNFGNVWLTNKEYISEHCFCADLDSTESARLRFRLTQTYSPIYEDIFGVNMKYASTSRVLINGEQLNTNFTVNNNVGSPYFLRNFSFNDYLGGQVEICFQTSTLTDKENDPYGIGDQVMIDNIVIIADKSVALKEIEIGGVSIYPNPAQNQVNIEHGLNSSDINIEVLDIQGRITQVVVNNINSNKSQLNVSNLTSGLYIIRIQSNNKLATGKFIVKK